jgi:cytochrome c biogenesis protein
MANRQSGVDRFLRFFSSLKCGLLLLGLVGVTVILGTLILQRPMAQEGQIEQIYAPQTLRLLNALGLFDVFHTWWFILLLGFLGANISLTSIERFPQVWRLFVRPHLVADAAFIRALPFQREIALGSRAPQEAMALACSKLRNLGYAPRPEVLRQGTVYVEKHRVARLAPYVVHASLLVIFAGAIVDGTHGYRGFINLQPGMRTDTVEPLAMPGTPRRLGFTIRCDAAGMDRYPDGSPQQYWSRLAVEENGREVMRKQIFVNDPLTYKGVRFFQANYGSTGTPRTLRMEASWPENGVEKHQMLTLGPGTRVQMGEQGTTVVLADFIPDFVLDGNQIASRSDEPLNPAIHLQVTRPGSQPRNAWILAKSTEMNPPNDTGVSFRYVNVEMEYMTGLQVAHEPGQWLIWAGCLLLTGGLMMALYLSHIRIWGVVGNDRKGRPVLLLGGQPSKYRENFERKFHELAGELEKTLQEAPAKESAIVPAA